MKGMTGVSRAFKAMGQALGGMMQRSIVDHATQEIARVKKSRGKGKGVRHAQHGAQKTAWGKRAATKRRNIRARSAK